MIKNWEDIVKLSNDKIRELSLGDPYPERLNFELKEIDKQGANQKWVNYAIDKKKFASNPNNLILPWLLGMVEQDPMATRTEPMLNTVRSSAVRKFNDEHGFIPSDIIKDADMPDIDIDCLPEARDPIKEYATTTYGQDIDDGYGPVCSVGTWQTYKFKNAIIDACVGTGLVERYEAHELTKNLPETVDQLKDNGKAVCKGRIKDQNGERECGNVHGLSTCPACGSTDTDGPTIGKLLEEHKELAAFASKYKEVVSYAIKLVGRIRNMGMHAGALIIADRSLYGNVPMSRNADYWVSMWTEGRNTQLSKFGYNKWDILGLKTLKYIFECSKLIETNRGISFGENMAGWEYNNPLLGHAGWYIDDSGDKCFININDAHALKLANEQKTDGVFQFDTDLAKSILNNGVRNFEDLMLFNAMGHPGPMASIPEAVKNRDDISGSWKKKLHPLIYDVLKDTYGVIVYQEQLQTIWQKLAGFTAPEAQEARKAVAKKWTHKLKPIREKWLEGASRSLGQREAEEWWSKMETFGRYAFNRCLGKHTILEDSKTGERKTAQAWHTSGRSFNMLSYDGERVIHDECITVHQNTPQEVFQIIFENDHTEMVTMNHKFLCEDGKYYEVREIIDGKLKVTEITSKTGIKIIRHDSLGIQQTYSPEMKSKQHNYIRNGIVHRNSHAVSYCLVAFKCLWLKAHFAPEFWAAVMSDCHPDKLVRYMGIARAEKWKPTEITKSGAYKQNSDIKGVKFDTLNISNMTSRFTVTGDVVNQGLIGIKGIGEEAAEKYKGVGEFTDIDDFIEKKSGKDKGPLERLIKLGVFKHLPGHENSKALWHWYQYKYCSGTEITKLRNETKQKLLELDGWNEKTIDTERKRMIEEYKRQYPNKKVIPKAALKKMTSWAPKPDDRREKVMSLITEDFTLSEILGFEKEYLGYYLHSPLDLYHCTEKCTIEDAKTYGKDEPTKLEVIISKIDFAVTKTGKEYAKIFVSDGVQDSLVMMWSNEMRLQNADNLTPGTGVQMYVEYDETRNTFSLARNEIILKLKARR
jgi:DNA polymerase III alpha subunit